MAQRIRRKARRIARKYNIPVQLVERTLWEQIDLRDEILLNRYPR